MNEHYLQGLPQQSGGYFTGSSSRNDEQQKWAKITGSTTVAGGIVLYSWTEYTPWALGLIQAEGMMFGTVSPRIANPIIEVNGTALSVGQFVKVRQGYFDGQYDWVFFAESAGLPSSPTTFAVQIANPQTCFAASVAATSNKVIEWSSGSVTGTAEGYVLVNDSSLGAHGGSFNAVQPGAHTHMHNVALNVSGTFGAAGRIDVYILWKAGGGGLGQSVVAAATLFVQNADIGNAVVLSCSGMVQADGTGSDRIYAVIYNDTAGAFTFGSSRLPLGINQQLFVSPVSPPPS